MEEIRVSSDQGTFPVYTGSQRTLRFVALLYLVWYTLLAVGGIVSVGIFLLFDVDVSTWGGAPAPNRAVALANGTMYALDVIFNLCVAVSAWMAANHPVIAKRFRIFAGVLVALSVISIAYAAFFAQLANTMTGLYSLMICGLLFYLANQISHEFEEGSAVDFNALACTSSGHRLRTEHQIKRALQRGEHISLPAESSNRAKS